MAVPRETEAPFFFRGKSFAEEGGQEEVANGE
jgi:hypothetical protein